MSRAKETLTISIDPDHKKSLETLAALHNCNWGDKPNISRLITKLAQGRIRINPKEELTPIQAEAILKGLKLLASTQINPPTELLKLLKESSTLPPQELESLELCITPPTVKHTLQELITEEQPFEIAYTDEPNYKYHRLTALKANLILHQDTLYLTLTSPKKNPREIKELQHNWLIPLDLIKEISNAESHYQWLQSPIPSITTSFTVPCDNFHYQPHPNDIKQELRGYYYFTERTIFHSELILEELLNITIISPESLREKAKKQIENAMKNYE